MGAGTGFSKRLRDLGARHDVIALDGAPHGLENWEGRAEWTTYKGRMVEWIFRKYVAVYAGVRSSAARSSAKRHLE